MEKTDSELVDLARSGNKEAFGRLIERHQPRALRVARSMVADEDAAQEIVQEAMLQAYLSLDHLRDGARFASWIHGIVRNVCRHYLRDREPDCLSWEALEGEPGMAAPATADPEQVAEQREQARLVLDAVHTLSPPNRETTLLFYYEQRSLQEIAAALNISVGAVKSRLHQSRKQLRERLRPLYPEGGAVMPGSRRRRRMIKVSPVRVSHPQDPTASERDAQQYLMEIILSSGYGRNRVCLMEEGGSRFLPLQLGWDAGLVGAVLSGGAADVSPAGALTGNLLQVTGSRLEEVRIEPLKDEILHGVVRLRHGARSHEISARPGEAIAVALQTDTPIYLAQEILTAGSWDLSDSLALVKRLRQTGDEASLRLAAEGSFMGRVTQGILEYGIRCIQADDEHRPAEVELEPRRMGDFKDWKAIFMLCHYGGGSSGGGNIPLPLEVFPVLAARFKLMANLDLADRQTPQQGRTRVQHKGQGYDLTVSTEPTELGEKVILRLEQKEAC